MNRTLPAAPASLVPASCRVSATLKRGDKGPAVTVLQEWLTLHHHRIAIDGDFGPATEHALLKFGGVKAMRPATAAGLVAPMERALLATGSVLDIAAAYLREGAREVGGQNRGPWIRSIAGDDHEGEAWCAHYCAKVATQAGVAWAGRISASCDVTGWRARTEGRLVAVPEVGGLFLVRGSSKADPWAHMGIVTGIGEGWVETNEGNSNDEGSREGHEVCRRVRGVSRLDFVRVV